MYLNLLRIFGDKFPLILLSISIFSLLMYFIFNIEQIKKRKNFCFFFITNTFNLKLLERKKSTL